MWWQVEIPTLTQHGTGVQVFTYPQSEFAVSYQAKRRALADAIGEDAVRHRRGAGLDLTGVTVSTHQLD